MEVIAYNRNRSSKTPLFSNYGNQPNFQIQPNSKDTCIYKMVIAEVEEVFLKYKSQEENIDFILRQKDALQTGASLKIFSKIKPLELSTEEAKERNKSILKELEFVKGNLRSKAIFSPTELQWEKVSEQYQNKPSLSVTTWHCHLPVFV